MPSWYAVATADRIIHPDAQRFMAKRALAHTSELEGSHAIAGSQPVLIAEQICTAAGELCHRPLSLAVAAAALAALWLMVVLASSFVD